MDYFKAYANAEAKRRRICEIVERYHFACCTDNEPVIEIVDWKGIKTLAMIKFENFVQFEDEVRRLV